MNKTISILGCGWYGLPLAVFLQKFGYHIKGSTTTKSKLVNLKSLGIESYLIDLSDEKSVKSNLVFFDCDILIVNVPPKRIETIELQYIEMMNVLLSACHKKNIQLVFISSTSVYGERDVTDESFEINPDKSSGKALLNAEKLLFNHFKNQLLILRFAGLIGADRHPGRFLAEKRQLKEGNAPVNLVHLDDCIQITYQLIQNNIISGIYNVCCDDHPKRADFYKAAAIKAGCIPPEFEGEDQQRSYKIVTNQKLKKALGKDFKFKYASPLDAI